MDPAGNRKAWSASGRRRRTRHSRPRPLPPPSRGDGCRDRSRRSAPGVRAGLSPRATVPSCCPRCTPSAPSRFARAMLSLTMNATPASAQMRCSGSARRANSCSRSILDPQLESRDGFHLGNGPKPVWKVSADFLRAKSDRAGTARSFSEAGIRPDRNRLPKLCGDLLGRSLVDLVDRLAQRPVEFLIAHVSAEDRRAERARSWRSCPGSWRVRGRHRNGEKPPDSATTRSTRG